VVTNAGGLRKNTIQSGELRASDIFELLPFENALVEVELSGVQLLTLLQRVTEDRNAQAGARIQFRWNEQSRPEFISAKLVDAAGNERDIEPAKTYVVVTTDYLMKLNSGNYAILKDGKNAKPLKITIREAVIDYVKAETAAGRKVRSSLDGRFVQVGPDPVRTEDRP
jgi:2',3'-cyclic-nucleotide 2'-phosphodiesterase (5'-nucleotidase family)